MKFLGLCTCPIRIRVTLHARVWIEILHLFLFLYTCMVTLHARVWIEIFRQQVHELDIMSPSTRGCGLKYIISGEEAKKAAVTLHARVWIEILSHAVLVTF